MEIQGISILVKPDPNPKQIGSIIVPKTAAKMHSKGEVLDCGPECTVVSKGDRIIYSAKGGSIIPIDDEEHHFITEQQVQYVYGEGES